MTLAQVSALLGPDETPEVAETQYASPSDFRDLVALAHRSRE